MLLQQLRGAWCIALKDIRAYYFKPPNLSWGILFPGSLFLALYLRTPGDMSVLIPGMVAMTLLFGTTSMAAIVITFEKRVGALERLLTAPLFPSTVLLGKMLGAVLFGLTTSGVVLVASCCALDTGLAHPLALVVTLAAAGLAFGAMGIFVAVSVREVFEAQTLANLFRFPMLFLSGVFYPVEAMSPALGKLSCLVPLTHAVSGLRAGMLGAPTAKLAAGPLTLSAFAILFFLLALRGFHRTLLS